jgi:hypothetical protein
MKRFRSPRGRCNGFCPPMNQIANVFSRRPNSAQTRTPPPSFAPPAVKHSPRGIEVSRRGDGCVITAVGSSHLSRRSLFQGQQVDDVLLRVRQPTEGKFVNLLFATVLAIAYCRVNRGDANTQSEPARQYDPGPFEHKHKHYQWSASSPFRRLLPRCRHLKRNSSPKGSSETAAHLTPGRIQQIGGRHGSEGLPPDARLTGYRASAACLLDQ